MIHVHSSKCFNRDIGGWDTMEYVFYKHLAPTRTLAIGTQVKSPQYDSCSFKQLFQQRHWWLGHKRGYAVSTMTLVAGTQVRSTSEIVSTRTLTIGTQVKYHNAIHVLSSN